MSKIPKKTQEKAYIMMKTTKFSKKEKEKPMKNGKTPRKTEKW